jgi:hypothetical protein
LGLLQRNDDPGLPKENDDTHADYSDNDDNTVTTFNTTTLPVDKITRIRTAHRGELGDGWTSDVDGDGFDIIQDFKIAMVDNENDKLLNEYDVTKTCVDDGTDNTSLLGTTELHLPGAPTGRYPPVAPDNWKPRERKPKTKEPPFSSVGNSGNWSELTYLPGFTGKIALVHTLHTQPLLERFHYPWIVQLESVRRTIFNSITMGGTFSTPIPCIVVLVCRETISSQNIAGQN